MIRAAVVRFPGSNCDQDTLQAVQRAGAEAFFVWHKERHLNQAEFVLLPGGFSYGDYLRSGAIARFSPIMEAVRRHAAAGGPVLGICNGFQILCEAGLLPGALLPNAGLRFVSRPIPVRVETTTTPFTNAFIPGTEVTLPVAHGEGRFLADRIVLRALEDEGRVVLRYVAGANPNGSSNDIAGICNPDRNVVGIMPHPERAADATIGPAEGAPFFTSWASGDPSGVLASHGRTVATSPPQVGMRS